MPYNVKCEQCQTDIIVTPSRFQNRDIFFCGKKCEGIYRKTKCTSKIKCYCIKCKKEMFLKKSEYERRNKKGKITCSRRCSDALKKETYQGRDNPNCKYPTLSDDFFKEINSEEKAYILGWIASDGHVAKNGAISISIKKSDIDILNRMRDIVCKDIPVFYIKNKTMSTLRFCSTPMSKDICKWLSISPGEKSFTIRLPKLNEGFTWAFLRGYFDGDGHLTKTTNKTRYLKSDIASCSSKMRNDIKNFTKIQCSNSDKTNRIYWSGKNAMSFLDKIYENADVYLERKYNRYLEWKLGSTGTK